MFLIQVFLPWITVNKLKKEQEPVLPSYFISFIILTLSSIAFTFYLRYVGLVPVTFYIVFKIILICLVPTVVLRVYDAHKELGQQNELLLIEKKILQKQIEKFEDGITVKTIEILSENATERLTFHVAEIAYIKSADNYVEIIYKEGDGFKKKLIRNTLKNIELQIKQFSNFVRCHRTCIVNIHSIEKLHKSYNNHWLIIKGYQEQIPVSRQYMLKLKESL
jgi:DNA-binding LytR/AlgR family response regulator